MDKNKYSIEYDNVLNRTIYYKQHKLPNNKIVKPVEKEVIIPVEKEIIEKPKDKKKRIIKKIVYEDGSEDEVEDVRHTQPKQSNHPYNNHETYSKLVYQSACDRLKEKVQDERTKYLISSLMPNYG